MYATPKWCKKQCECIAVPAGTLKKYSASDECEIKKIAVVHQTVKPYSCVLSNSMKVNL